MNGLELFVSKDSNDIFIIKCVHDDSRTHDVGSFPGGCNRDYGRYKEKEGPDMNKLKRFGRSLMSKIRSEKGENTITMLIAFPFIWAIIMTILDFGIYMQDRTMLISDLREGARTVAIFGGSSTDPNSATGNALIKAYGINCSDQTHSGQHDYVACLIQNRIAANNAYASIVISDIQCGPYKVNTSSTAGQKASITFMNNADVKIGQAVGCMATYDYAGFPGSALGLLGGNFMMSGMGGNDTSLAQTNKNIQDSGWNHGTVMASAQSEVTMDNDGNGTIDSAIEN